MPVRSSTSSVLPWPDRAAVEAALRRWAEEASAVRPELRRVGYHGSYARGDWGVGSDLDVVLVVAYADRPARDRPARWDLTDLPVPVDLWVYTAAEWEALPSGRLRDTLRRETVWIVSDDRAP